MSFERPLRLLSTFSALGVEIDVQTFDARFLIQKRAYFLQEFGVDLGYVFGMYIHGPYSPVLTRDAYNLQDLEYTPEEIKSVSIKTDAIDRTKGFMKDVDEMISGSKGKIYWLELLASLHFLSKYGYQKVKDLEEARNQTKLASFGSDIDTGFSLLQRHKLIQVKKH